MRARTTLTVLAGLATAAVVGPTRTAAACATCSAGDPTLTSIGAEQPFDNRVRVSLIGQHRTGEDGSIHTVEQRADLGISWTPSGRWTLSAGVPFVRRVEQYENLGRAVTHGPGDVELRARYLVWADSDFSPSHLLSIQPGVDLPTSARMPVTFELQPGRGAFSPSLGAVYGAFFDPLSLYASTTVHWPLVSRFDVLLGPSCLATGLGQWQPFDWLALRAGVDARWSAKDRLGAGPVDSSGGVVGFASAGIAVSPYEDLIVDFTVRIPVVVALAGAHDEGPAFVAGLTYDL